MSASLNYYWRLTATGFCFAVFGFGGLALTTFVFPALLMSGSGGKRSVRARRIIHKAFRTFMQLMERCGVMRFEISGAERLTNCRKTLILANHPTLIDVVALISLIPTASCVVKRSLWDNPFLGGVVRAARYISNGDSEQLIAQCAEDLAAGNPLVIFPEGTRSQPGEPLRFLRGASYIALRSGLPILPVLINCSPTTLTKREKWFQIPHRRFDLRIKVLDPISCDRWLSGDEPLPIAARKLTQGLENYFTEELKIHAKAEA